MSEENLMLEVGGSATKAVTEIEKVISKMQKLQSAFVAAVPSIAAFSNQLNGIGSKADSALGKLATSVSKATQSVDKQTLSSAKSEAQMAMYQARLDRAVASSARAQQTLDKLSESNKKAGDDAKFAAEAEQSFADAIARCAAAGSQTQTSIIGGGAIHEPVKLTGTKTASEMLGGSLGIQEAMDSIGSSTSKMKKLKESVSDVAEPTNKASKAIKDLGESAQTASTKSSGLSNMFSNLKTYMFAGIVYKTAGALADSIKSAMSYTENMNLFNVAMGDTAAKAGQFVDSMQKAFGLDPNNLIKNMGVFYQVATSMGVTSKNAYTLSENFTKLSEDIASYYNISIESANEKLNAGLVGQTKPLRSIGVIITQNALQQTAYANGIKESVKDMSEAEKIHLRYLTILNQTKNAQGDFARTLNSPMNSMRVLTEQMSQLSRAIGSLFIPMLVQVMPYAIAFSRALTIVINGVSALAGYEAPTYKSGANGYVGSLADDADNASSAVSGTVDKVKELQRQVMGFDELNVLSKKTDTSSGKGVGGAGGIGDNLGLGDFGNYDNLLGTINDKTKRLTDSIVKGITDFTDKVKNSPAWKLLSDFWNNVAMPFGKWILNNPDTVLDFLLPIVAAFASFKIVSTVVGWISKFKAAIDGATGIGSILLKLGSTGGWIALAVGAFAGLGVAVWELGHTLMQQHIAEEFGNITLSAEDMNKLMSTIDTPFLKASRALDESRKSLDSEAESLNSTGSKIKDTLENMFNVGATNDDLKKLSSSVDTFITDLKSHLTKETSQDLSLWGKIFKYDGSVDTEEQKMLDEISTHGKNVDTEIDGIRSNIAKSISTAINSTGDTRKAAIAAAQADMEKLQILSDANFGKTQSTIDSIEAQLKQGGLTQQAYEELNTRLKDAVKKGNAELATELDNANQDAYKKYKMGEWSYAEYQKALIDSANINSSEKQKLQEQGNLVVDYEVRGMLAKIESTKSTLETSYKQKFQDAYKSAYAAAQKDYGDTISHDKLVEIARNKAINDTSGMFEQLINEYTSKTVALVEEIQKSGLNVQSECDKLGIKIPKSIMEGLELGTPDGEKKLREYFANYLNQIQSQKDPLSSAGVSSSLAQILGMKDGYDEYGNIAYNSASNLGSNTGNSLINSISNSVNVGASIITDAVGGVFSADNFTVSAVSAGATLGGMFAQSAASAIENTPMPSLESGIMAGAAIGMNCATRWNAVGGVFDSPTIIGYGVGEAGKEAIMPLNDSVYTEIAKGIVSSAPTGQHSNNSDAIVAELSSVKDAISNRIDKLEFAIRNMNVSLYSDDREIAKSANNGNAMLGRKYSPIAST